MRMVPKFELRVALDPLISPDAESFIRRVLEKSGLQVMQLGDVIEWTDGDGPIYCELERLQSAFGGLWLYREAWL